MIDERDFLHSFLLETNYVLLHFLCRNPCHFFATSCQAKLNGRSLTMKSTQKRGAAREKTKKTCFKMKNVGHFFNASHFQSHGMDWSQVPPQSAR